MCVHFYSSVNLYKELLSKDTYACGTVRLGRKGLPTNLEKTVKQLNKKERGTHVSIQVGPVLVLAWKDTKVVQLLSTCDKDTTTKVKRKTKQGSRVDVSCPTIAKYNKYMGGVDMSDQLLVSYSIARRSKRWWLKLAFQMIEVALVNSYILARK